MKREFALMVLFWSIKMAFGQYDWLSMRFK